MTTSSANVGTVGHKYAVKTFKNDLDTAQHDLLLHSYFARPESVHLDPSEHLLEHSVPASVAKSMVSDILELNMNPRTNMCGWLTTHMEEEGADIIRKSLYINAIDAVQYPSASMMAQRCVAMAANRWNARQNYTGTETVGSTEACYLGVLAMKKNKQKQLRESIDLHSSASTASFTKADVFKPNLIFGANAQIAWQKACSYFDIELRLVPLHENQLVIDPEKIVELADENTIGVACTVGSTYTGQ